MHGRKDGRKNGKVNAWVKDGKKVDWRKGNNSVSK